MERKGLKVADRMTPTVISGVKRRLTGSEFIDVYLILTRLREMLQPTGSSESMRLSKGYYTFQYSAFNSISEYLTPIKVLEERIDVT